MNARNANTLPAGARGMGDKKWQRFDHAVHHAFDKRLHLRQGFRHVFLRLLKALSVGNAAPDMDNAGGGERRFRSTERAVDISMRVLTAGSASASQNRATSRRVSSSTLPRSAT